MIRKLIRFCLRWRYSFFCDALPSWLIRRKGVTVGQRNRFWGLPIVSLAGNSTIRVGSDGVFCSRSEKTALGVNHAIILRTFRAGACLKIGDGAQMSGTTICCADQVTIGNRVFFGANVTVSDTDFHSLVPALRNSPHDAEHAKVQAVKIGDDVFIGMNATILKGVEIGSGAVIGAGSVVTRSVASNMIVAGNPARALGEVK